MVPDLRIAADGDLAPCLVLLTACELPTRGLERDFPSGYVVASTGDLLLGCAGVERYGTAGLLRSVAVGSAARGSGLGGRLAHDRIAHARAHGLASLWLLTTTAPGFFERIGFTPVSRVDAPAALRDSEEFAHVCPASAVCMRLHL
jgi:N-acetylglutamate synthase-like GNAT family acetyltransferase